LIVGGLFKDWFFWNIGQPLKNRGISIPAQGVSIAF
jgi:hypothetical protein